MYYYLAISHNTHEELILTERHFILWAQVNFPNTETKAVRRGKVISSLLTALLEGEKWPSEVLLVATIILKNMFQFYLSKISSFNIDLLF